MTNSNLTEITSSQNSLQIKDQDFKKLVNDCKEIIIKYIYPAGWELCLGYWRMGKRILEDERDGRFSREFGDATISKLGIAIGFSPSQLYRIIGAAERFPTREALEQWKAEYIRLHNNEEPTWSDLRAKALPPPLSHPEKYGGQEAVIEEIMKDTELLGSRIEQLQEALERPGISHEIREEIQGLISKCEEISADSIPKRLDIPLSRSESYLVFIRTRPCSVGECGRESEPHHIGGRGMGIKSSDFLTIPLCREHHEECESSGISTFQHRHSISFVGIVIENLILFIENQLSITR